MTRADHSPTPVDRLREACTPLETTDPNADHGPLRALDAALADAAVVGLGEATHRTREFVRFRHRLVRYLVERHGCRGIALEAPFSETVALNDYVVAGDGDLRECLAGLGFPVCETEAFAALAAWLRSFNDGRPRSDRVAVYGIDVQSAAGPAAALRAFLADVDARPPDALLNALDAAAGGVFDGGDVDADALRAAARAADGAAEWVAANAVDAPVARRHLWALRRAARFARLADEDRATQWGFRDECMAEQVAWVRDRADAGPVAVWAHDNHVKRGRMTGAGHPARTMGDRLGERYGDAYYALGSQFASGTVRAYAPTDAGTADVETADGAYAMTRFDVPAPEPGSVPALFDALDSPVAVADFRSLRDDSPLADWLAAERAHRYVSGVVDPDDDRPFARQYSCRDAYDGVYFVADATPTVPL